MDLLNNIPEVAYVRAWAATAIGSRREQERDERGIGVVEWVIIASIVAAAAIVIATLVMNKFKEQAENIPTG